MKRLKTDFDGGYPLKLDDIRYLSEGMYEAFLAICRAMLPPGQACMKLQGCDVSNTSGQSYTVTEGYVYIASNSQTQTVEEICHVPAGEVTLEGSERLVFMPIDNYSSASASNRVFFDGSSHSVFYNREAVLAGSTDQGYPGALDVQSYGGDWIPTNYLYSRLSNGFLSIKGMLVEGFPGADALPLEHRQDYLIKIPIAAFYWDAENNYTATLIIDATTGAFSIYDPLHPDSNDITYFINVVIPI